MKVIFLDHVLHVAKAWEVKEVSSWYATNFLFPKKLAEPYSQEIENRIAQKNQKKESDRRMLLGSKKEILDGLEHQVFEFFLKTDESGKKVYGSISPKEIATYISKKYHFPLTKKHVKISYSSIKTLWDHDIYIDLGNNFAVKAVVRISPQV